MSKTIALALLVSMTAFSPRAQALAPRPKAQALTHVGLYVFDADKKFLKIFRQHPELTIDHVGAKGLEVYGAEGLEEWVRDLGADYIVIQDYKSDKEFEEETDLAGYPSYNVWSKALLDFAAQNTDIMHIFSIGKTVQGKDLWFVKLSDNVGTDELEPEMKYVANMHGDEIVGREAMLRLIRDLVDKYRAGDAQAQKLLNSTELFIMPSLNPDGADARRRGNGAYVDLNRDFPDFSTTDNQNTPNGRAPETQAMMRFQATRHFALSANFHGGAEVVNYPWDTVPEPHPLDGLVKEISLEYAARVPGMHDSHEFPGGVTNGYHWYEVDGGMQDWSYFWYNDLQVTVELSNTKYPDYSTVDGFYRNNYASLMSYALRIMQGAGFRLSQTEGGSVTVVSHDREKTSYGPYSFTGGEFYKVLPAGRYTFKVTTASRGTQEFEADVSDLGEYVELL